MLLPWLAKRIAHSENKPLFMRFFSIIGVGGTALGVFSLILVLSVMNGFADDMRQKVTGFDGSLTVRGPESLLKKIQGQLAQKGPARGHLYYEGEAIVRSESGETMGVKVRGLEQDDPRLTELFDIEYASLEGAALLEQESGSEALILGQQLAASLAVHPAYEDQVLLISPIGDIGPGGEFLPRIKSFTVAGVFKSGYFDFDNQYLFMSYAAAKKLFPPLDRTRSDPVVHLVYDQLTTEASLELKQKIISENPSLQGQSPVGAVLTWEESHKKLFDALQMERFGMWLLMSMIILVAGVTIFGMLSLLVLEKMRELAVLRTLGLSRRSGVALFVIQGLRLGLSGTGVGGLLAIGLLLFLQTFPIPLPPSFYLDTLPIKIDWGQVLLILSLAPFLSLITVLAPALQSGQLKIAEVLKYE